MNAPICIVWFRKDLRLADNPALYHATKNGFRVLPVYIDDSESEGEWSHGSASRCWLHYSLQSLNDDLTKIGGTLLTRKGPSKTILFELIEKTGAKAVYWNRRYEPQIIARDSKIKESLLEKGVKVESFNASLLVEPWKITNKSGKPFQVFTAFWKHVKNTTSLESPLPGLEDSQPNFLTNTSNLNPATVGELELRPDQNWDKGFWSRFKPGESGALQSLQDFIELQHIHQYSTSRDRPDLEQTSRLSPHLAFGEISPRTIFSEIRKHDLESLKGTQAFESEIGWREFAYHLLFHFPFTVNKPLKPKFDNFPWENNPDQLKRWQTGTTGIPIIDAGMRELWTTGWMHNRVRMIVGSYLVKNLMIPWQEGASWFWETLVDADLASNSLGWQWVAGSGADAAPYFRIFNPILQSQKFDPEGTYIRRWIPELSSVRGSQIHTPWRFPETLRETGYPEKQISLIESRNRALSAYQSLT